MKYNKPMNILNLTLIEVLQEAPLIFKDGWEQNRWKTKEDRPKAAMSPSPAAAGRRTPLPAPIKIQIKSNHIEGARSA